MYRKNKTTAAVTIALAALLMSAGLAGQNLWQDHNPYGAHQNLRQGTILKLEVDEPVQIRYEYENLSDEDVTIKIVPDQGITELPPADSTKSITTKKNSDLESNSRLKFRMAVTVQADVENDVVTFSGTKLIAQEDGRTRQLIRISGRVHTGDIKAGRRVHSNDIADFQVLVNGGPIPQTRDLPLKTVPGDEPGDPPQPSAELSDREREQLLLEYLNRILGESGDTP
ncbi:MAG: flagellar basal body L-ring protein FlgH [Leptospirales bacterium]|jgi:hypothetical protein